MSLFGFEPDKDFLAVTRDSLARHINPVDPDNSLLLLKATGQVEHGGGMRFGKDSWQYAIFRQWITAGAPSSKGSGDVKHVAVHPPELAFNRADESRQVVVKATFADGSEHDIATFCDFRSNDDAVAEVTCEGFSRRDFIKVGSAGLLGLTLPQLLKLESEARANQAPAVQPSRQATSVIMVWLAGGPATIDMWDLRPNAPEGIRGEFREIPTAADGIKICEHLPQMARVMDRCTIVRSLAHTIPSHGPATVFMTTGNRPTPALQYPALGSLVTRLMPAATGVPPYVSFTDPCTPDDVSATIFSRLGIDPHTELQTPTGRPVQLFREGRVLPRLIGYSERQVPG